MRPLRRRLRALSSSAGCVPVEVFRAGVAVVVRSMVLSAQPAGRQRLQILWHMAYYGIPRNRVAEHFVIARSTLYRWLHAAERGDLGEKRGRTENPRKAPAELARMIRGLDHLSELLRDFEIHYNEYRGHARLGGAVPSVSIAAGSGPGRRSPRRRCQLPSSAASSPRLGSSRIDSRPEYPPHRTTHPVLCGARAAAPLLASLVLPDGSAPHSCPTFRVRALRRTAIHEAVLPMEAVPTVS